MSGGIAIGFVDVAVFCFSPIASLRFGWVVSGAKSMRLLVQTSCLFGKAHELGRHLQRRAGSST